MLMEVSARDNGCTCWAVAVKWYREQSESISAHSQKYPSGERLCPQNGAGGPGAPVSTLAPAVSAQGDEWASQREGGGYERNGVEGCGGGSGAAE